jgi:OmpA-OmpF porin, OOP family
VKHSLQVLFLLGPTFGLFGLPALSAQAVPPPKLAPDQVGCVDSKLVPKLFGCRIDNCEQKDSDQRDVPVGEDGKGDAMTTSIEGNSKSVMYECQTGTTPASIVTQAAQSLKNAGFEIPYKFSDAEASLTARKDDVWVTVEAASRFYTLIETSSVEPDGEAVVDAASMFDTLQHYGRVPVFAIQFMPGRSDFTPDSNPVLEQLYKLMADHPALRLKVEGHTPNTGSKMGNVALTLKRATAVTAWLIAKGIDRERLDPEGMGDAHPIEDSTTEAGRAKNRRIELVKLPPLPGQPR